MNLNKWLCKHFDEKKKGYVTVGDTFERLIYYGIIVGYYGIIVGAILLIIYSIWVFIKDDMYWGDGKDDFILSELGGAVFTMLLIGLVVLVLGTISRIKIAKCPLKEDDKK